jgi:hypothetical protein
MNMAFYAAALLVLFVVKVGPLGAEPLVPPVDAKPLVSPERTMTGTILGIDTEASSFAVRESRFVVDAATDIRGYDNLKIAFAALPVPCKAEITFRLKEDNTFRCLKLRVKGVLDRKKAGGG